MVVTATMLNGRAKPTTKSTIEAFFDRGDLVEPTGKWSDDRQWVEVVAGETGTVWCAAGYLTECPEPVYFINDYGASVKIRRSPVDGKVVGYLKPDETLLITQVVLGWGKSDKGWINIGYLSAIEN